MMLQMQKSLNEKDIKIDALAAHNRIIDTQLAQMATSVAGKTVHRSKIGPVWTGSGMDWIRNLSFLVHGTRS